MIRISVAPRGGISDNPAVGFGHIYVNAEQGPVLEAVERHLTPKGFRRVEMKPEWHPKRMKPFHENEMRLYWVSPRIGRWTGIFEFRYYNNEFRERWGYTDDELAKALSKDLSTDVYRMEVIDSIGFWMYNHFVGGDEKAWKLYEDNPFQRSLDRAHPRYELNHLIEREGLVNVGLGYENVPGPQVCRVEQAPQDGKGILGLEGFRHAAFVTGEPKPLV